MNKKSVCVRVVAISPKKEKYECATFLSGLKNKKNGTFFLRQQYELYNGKKENYFLLEFWLKKHNYIKFVLS